MAAKGLLVVLFGAAVVRGGCMQSTIEPASEANLTVRDKKLLAAAPYEKATIPEPYRRHLVEYHRKEMPGTIVIDSDARYLYYVLPEGKAIRYGVTVGEEAMAWSGVAKVERMTEWPSWTPSAGERQRMDVPAFVQSGPTEPNGRARHVPLRGQQGHALSHPRHQPAGVYWPGNFFGLHPHDQRGRH
jgi:lipoprotein-anchoring transpeptidase ErfK/SrfK